MKLKTTLSILGVAFFAGLCVNYEKEPNEIEYDADGNKMRLVTDVQELFGKADPTKSVFPK